jgi:hypothetical protein
MSVDLPGTKMSLTADLVQSVGRPDKTGAYEVKTVTKNMRVITDADRQDVDAEPPTVERYDAQHRRIPEDDASNDWFANNLGHCTDFIAPAGPVKVGQKWSTAVKASGGLLAGRLDYRLADVVVREKRTLLHVRYAYTESASHMPVKAEGYFYIDPRDFSVAESDAVVHNARISPDLPQSPNVEVHMVRVDHA